MKTQKSTLIATIVCLLLCASGIAEAEPTVIVEDGSVVQILNLLIVFDVEDSGLFDVDFIDASGFNIYNDGVDYDFPFRSQEDTISALIEVINALNAVEPVPTAAGPSGRDQYFIGIDYNPVLELIGCIGGEYYSDEEAWDQCSFGCIFGVTARDPASTHNYAVFTPSDTSGNLPPTADADGPYTGSVGVAFSFDGSGSVDPDGDIVSYNWIFGDGGTGTGETPSYTYEAAGNYIVILEVTDDKAVTDADFSTVAILDEQSQCGDPGYPYPEGDLDFNCYVDLGDFIIMASNWLTCTDPNPPCNFVP